MTSTRRGAFELSLDSRLGNAGLDHWAHVNLRSSLGLVLRSELVVPFKDERTVWQLPERQEVQALGNSLDKQLQRSLRGMEPRDFASDSGVQK